MNRLMRLARSPRVAIALILGIGLYAGAVTIVPQQSLLPVEHAQWLESDSPLVGPLVALGLDRAYTNPLFLMLAAALAFSTAVCSWDRTKASLRLWRGRGTVTQSLATRLAAGTPLATVPDGAGSAQEVVGEAMSALGMRRRAGVSLTYAERGAIGLFGSPLFHWALVALIIVVALGQLTRWEGLIGVAQGASTEESAQSYGKLDQGPLPAPHTGWQLMVTDVDEDMEKGDVHYGVVPTVAVMSGREVLAEAPVYPNNPLREGPLLIHLSDHGLAVRVEVLDAEGRSQGSSSRLVDFDDTTESGTVPSGFDVSEAGSRIASISVEVPARDRNGMLPRLLPPNPVAAVSADLSDGSHVSQRLARGEEMQLAQGWKLKVSDISYYARLSVVRDWSVPWIYALLLVATVGLVLAILVPYRAVWLRLDESADGVAVRAVAVQHRRDAYFREAIVAALEQAAGAAGADAGDDSDGEGERA